MSFDPTKVKMKCEPESGGGYRATADDNPWRGVAIAATEERAKELAILVVSGAKFKASLRKGERVQFGTGFDFGKWHNG